ncbi:DUF2937 family protein [Halocynthiibacter namhaensis]|uniref:DUF2937 family protein n=1 Tax=Halocynthiibacter namhaensis TaxID=1290553 RepID=UPI0005793827|nr:DUF2937 family protein [Halocynthiibacter namhaensis]
MFLRVIAFAGGLAGAAGFSQFPEFSQQYLQRLGGAVEALEQVVADFDASAVAEGLSREAALDQMRGTAFLERRRDDMQDTISRFTGLRGDLEALESRSAWGRAAAGWRFGDAELISDTSKAFRPGLPLTLEGAGFAGAGFLTGWALLLAFFAVLSWPFRRKG